MYFWTVEQTTLKNESLQTVSVTSPAYTDNKLNERKIVTILMQKYTPCPKKIVPFFYFFFLGAQCVESGVSCTDCY